ncbi:MAG: histidinol dehydrogenase [Ferroplasma sp.]|uniref:histidinol dehydrogenase n=1 Tax=Ferroplasma sp. TaxID=2591003 RepID=UPI0028155921|nr:histidinol dehydrogenase [Ferroplasma sp.]WMT50570.1 MAG: histidinol dehydrogenase [Ferroplasma sp.]
MIEELKSEIEEEYQAGDIVKTVNNIIENVKSGGDIAVKQFEKKFDNVDISEFRMDDITIEQILSKVPGNIKEIIDTNIKRIEDFAKFQFSMYKNMEFVTDNGKTILGQKIVPIENVGVYIPGGRYPLLSTPPMTIIPARVAGCKRIIACTPPGENRPNPATLYGIIKSGATEVYTIGGAQAIAAMAYGTESIKPVNKIAGPGNAYVNEAKKEVFGKVGIDLLAGPSEILVLADETAKEEEVMADLLSQAEHDPSARCCLVTTSTELAHSIYKKMDSYINKLSTKEILKKSWLNHGVIALCNTLKEAVEYTNNYAAEHLELHLNATNTEFAFANLTNYGSVFLDHGVPAVFSDKLLGPNHTLPTLGAAKYSGGLSVGNFLKILTYSKVTDNNIRDMLAHRVKIQSDYEGFGAKARAAELRFKENYSRGDIDGR